MPELQLKENQDTDSNKYPIQYVKCSDWGTTDHLHKKSAISRKLGRRLLFNKKRFALKT